MRGEWTACRKNQMQQFKKNRNEKSNKGMEIVKNVWELSEIENRLQAKHIYFL